jgi:uncharacterized protein (DUF433 family)
MITSRSEVMGGQPVFTDSRLLVSAVLSCLKAGMTPEQVVAEYPQLSLDDIHDAQVYREASASTGNDRVEEVIRVTIRTFPWTAYGLEDCPEAAVDDLAGKIWHALFSNPGLTIKALDAE